MLLNGSGSKPRCPTYKALVTLSQANPVSENFYTVLPTTQNVRLLGIAAWVTWAVTQPTPLTVRVTIDGQVIDFIKADPVSATPYFAALSSYLTETTQALYTTAYGTERAFMLEGKSVKVEVALTWAITQPTPLVCRLRYAVWG